MISLAAPANSFCFSGTYSWILYNEINTYIFTLDVSTYLYPSVTWQINGNNAVAGTVTVPADVSLDPLLSYEFATPPSYNSLIDVTINNNVLTITTKSLQLPATLQVSCSVSENGLPAEYGTTKQTSLILPVYGWVRKMDNRFQQDLRFCGDKIFGIEKSGIKQKVKTIPIPIGDPGEKVKAMHLEGISKENQAGIKDALSRMDELKDKNSSLSKKLHQYVGSLITEGHQ